MRPALAAALASVALAPVAAAVVAAAPAQASTFTPGGGFTLNGTVETRLSSGPWVKCNLTLQVSDPPGGLTQVAGGVVTGCPGATVHGLPWTLAGGTPCFFRGVLTAAPAQTQP